MTGIAFPSREPDLYPVHCGPPTFYPAEALPHPTEPTEMPRPAVVAAQERMNRAVGTSEWLEYFQARTELLRALDDSVPEMPPPERTTAQGWPSDFAVPRGAASLLKAAIAAGWRTAHGYSRAYRAGIGRGEYHRCHFVGVQARRDGHGIRAVWWAKADTPKLSWSFGGGSVDGRAVERVGDVTGALG